MAGKAHQKRKSGAKADKRKKAEKKKKEGADGEVRPFTRRRGKRNFRSQGPSGRPGDPACAVN
jgi:hypothetical protein